MKRVIVDIILFLGIVLAFAFQAYTGVPAPLQLVLLKMMLVSAGLLHAHIARKLLFPKVDWKNVKFTPSNTIAIAFYIIIPLCYAFAG